MGTRGSEALVGLLVLVVLAALLLAPIESCACHDVREFSATVVSKQYAHAQNHVHTGFVSSEKGGIEPVITTSHEPEHWTVICATDGRTFAVDTSAVRWSQLSEGNAVNVTERVGWLTGSSYRRTIRGTEATNGL